MTQFCFLVHFAFFVIVWNSLADTPPAVTWARRPSGCLNVTIILGSNLGFDIFRLVSRSKRQLILFFWLQNKERCKFKKNHAYRMLLIKRKKIQLKKCYRFIFINRIMFIFILALTSVGIVATGPLTTAFTFFRFTKSWTFTLKFI